MSRVADLVNNIRNIPVGVGNQESPFSNTTYEELITALKGVEVTHFEILQDLLDVVMAHIAVGLSVYMDGGGPEISENSLQLEAGKNLIELVRNILEAQALMGQSSLFASQTSK